MVNQSISYDGNVDWMLPLGMMIKDSKKKPDSANKPHDDIFRPKKFNSVIDKIRLEKSTAPVDAT